MGNARRTETARWALGAQGGLPGARLTEGLLTWPRVYRLFQRMVGARNMRRAIVADLVRPRPGMRILDLGCGPADILELLDGVEYWGVDVNERYLETARRGGVGSGRFLCSEIDSSLPDRLPRFDLVAAIGLLHHLDDERAAVLFEVVGSLLDPGGRFVSVDPCLREGQSRFARRLVRSDRGQHVRDEAGYVRLAAGAFREIRPIIREDVLRIPYTQLFLECGGSLQEDPVGGG